MMHYAASGCRRTCVCLMLHLNKGSVLLFILFNKFCSAHVMLLHFSPLFSVPEVELFESLLNDKY
jgi:hypothetical protein